MDSTATGRTILAVPIPTMIDPLDTAELDSGPALPTPSLDVLTVPPSPLCLIPKGQVSCLLGGITGKGSLIAHWGREHGGQGERSVQDWPPEESTVSTGSGSTPGVLGRSKLGAALAPGSARVQPIGRSLKVWGK